VCARSICFSLRAILRADFREAITLARKTSAKAWQLRAINSARLLEA